MNRPVRQLTAGRFSGIKRPIPCNLHWRLVFIFCEIELQHVAARFFFGVIQLRRRIKSIPGQVGIRRADLSIRLCVDPVPGANGVAIPVIRSITQCCYHEIIGSGLQIHVVNATPHISELIHHFSKVIIHGVNCRCAPVFRRPINCKLVLSLVRFCGLPANISRFGRSHAIQAPLQVCGGSQLGQSADIPNFPVYRSIPSTRYHDLQIIRIPADDPVGDAGRVLTCSHCVYFARYLTAIHDQLARITKAHCSIGSTVQGARNAQGTYNHNGPRDRHRNALRYRYRYVLPINDQPFIFCKCQIGQLHIRVDINVNVAILCFGGKRLNDLTGALRIHLCRYLIR